MIGRQEFVDKFEKYAVGFYFWKTILNSLWTRINWMHGYNQFT